MIQAKEHLEDIPCEDKAQLFRQFLDAIEAIEDRMPDEETKWYIHLAFVYTHKAVYGKFPAEVDEEIRQLYEKGEEQ